MIEQQAPAARTLDPRPVPLGGLRGVAVERLLPHRDLRTVGAWCFLDVFGSSDRPMTVWPHPHVGLQTVTWPLAGQIRHRDSLGNDLVLRPGELNLMTAGAGVAHSEFDIDFDEPARGLQLWLALPDIARLGRAMFEHWGLLPRASGRGWEATVFIGELAGVASPATTFTPLTGAQLTVTERVARVPARPDFEYAVMVLDGGALMIDAVRVPEGSLRYLPPGELEIIIRAEPGSTVLLLGGEPFADDLLMWWNFVARSAEEIAVFHEAWNAAEGGFSARFGEVRGHGGAWIPAPPLPNATLRPRRRA